MNRRKKEDSIAHSIAARFSDGFRRRQIQVLLVLGHMRSGSSLLVHVLNSHPRITGYGETHIVYEREEDFFQLAEAVYSSFEKDEHSEAYVLDKILHDYVADPALLALPNVKVVFLVRDPVQTLHSLTDLDSMRGSSEALDYYVKQMKVLGRYASATKDNALLLTCDQLTSDTDAVLKCLQEYLGLRQPLNREYQKIWSTGLRGIGDSSDNIMSGCIESPRKRLEKVMPVEVIARAEAAFCKCVASLKQCSRFLDPI